MVEASADRESNVEGESFLHQLEVKKSRRVATAALVGLTCVLLASFLYIPSRVDANGQYFTLCGFKVLTGLPCPGCGLTHSFCAMGKANLGEAFAFNAVGPPLFVVCVLVWLRFLFALAGMKRPVSVFDRVDRLKVVRVFAIALGLFGIARIAYLLIRHSDGVQDSPLGHLIHRILT